MPGDPGVTVVTNSRVFYTTREAAGASSARHSLRPLQLRRRKVQVKLAQTCGGIAKLCRQAMMGSRGCGDGNALPLPRLRRAVRGKFMHSRAPSGLGRPFPFL